MPPRKDPKAAAEASAIPKASGKSSLANARAVMNKVYPGEKSSEVRIDEDRFRQSHPHLPTGSFIIDHLIGGIPNRYGVLPCPGFPRARLINLYGAESSGKTTMALTVCAETCRRGGTVLYIDWEHAIDIPYAKILGVPIDDPDSFLLVQPETLEKGLGYLWAMAKAGVDLIVIDSVAAGSTTAQWEQTIAEKGEIGRVGAKAAKWSEYLPQLKALISRTNTCVVGISQLRAKIDTGFHKGGGETTQAQGGMAWKFYSEVRLGLKKIKTEKGKRYDAITHTTEDVPTGNVVIAKIDKCKVSASQGREAQFYLVYGEGIDDVRSMLEMASSRGVIKKSGSWYAWERKDGTSIRAQGVDTLKVEILNAPGAWEELRDITLASLIGNPGAPTTIEDDFEGDDTTVAEIMSIIDGGTPDKPLVKDTDQDEE